MRMLTSLLTPFPPPCMLVQCNRLRLWNMHETPSWRPTHGLYCRCATCAGAIITLNGVVLGNTTNQHRRYQFPVGSLLRATDNRLTVSFRRDIANGGRFMDCSGGWDWGPYSRTRDVEGNPMFTRGIWKSVYLVAVSPYAIEYVVPEVLYNGTSWPVTAWKDGDADFVVRTTVHIHASAAVPRAVVTATGEWGQTAQSTVALQAGTNRVVLTLEANGPNLWWPRGLGAQALYSLNVSVAQVGSSDAPETTISTHRRVGFRLAALVTVRGGGDACEWGLGVGAHRATPVCAPCVPCARPNVRRA